MNIFQYLESQNLKFWSVEEHSSVRDELYMIKDEIESVRRVNRGSYLISIYVDHGTFTGSSRINIPTNLDISIVKREIDKAISQAKIVKNKFYPIEQDLTTYEVDNFSLEKDVLYEMSRVLPKKAILSSSEYFLTNRVVKYRNSFGNSYRYNTASLLAESVMLSEDKEIESYSLRRAPSLEKLDLENIIEEQERFTLDLRKAQSAPDGKFRVIFSSDILEEFFSFFLFHSLGSSFYDNYSVFKLNERVTKFDLSMRSVPMIGMNRSPADSLGFKYREFDILKEGYLKNIVANAKYSHYLDLPFTGEVSNLVIENGKTSYKDLIEEGSVIIEKVSCFSPKEITGDFSAEIRLGYIVKDGKLIPFKGGCFAANMRDFDKIELSREQVHYNSYIGPKAFALNGVVIKG